MASSKTPPYPDLVFKAQDGIFYFPTFESFNTEHDNIEDTKFNASVACGPAIEDRNIAAFSFTYLSEFIDPGDTLSCTIKSLSLTYKTK